MVDITQLQDIQQRCFCIMQKVQSTCSEGSWPNDMLWEDAQIVRMFLGMIVDSNVERYAWRLDELFTRQAEYRLYNMSNHQVTMNEFDEVISAIAGQLGNQLFIIKQNQKRKEQEANG